MKNLEERLLFLSQQQFLTLCPIRYWLVCPCLDLTSQKHKWMFLVKVGGRLWKLPLCLGEYLERGRQRVIMDEIFLLTPFALPLWVTPVFQSDWCCWHIHITRQKRKMRERGVYWSTSAYTKKSERKKIRGKDGVRLQSVLEVERQKWQIYLLLFWTNAFFLVRTHSLKAISRF